jgi:hypothetical protein
MSNSELQRPQPIIRSGFEVGDLVCIRPELTNQAPVLTGGHNKNWIGIITGFNETDVFATTVYALGIGYGDTFCWPGKTLKFKKEELLLCEKGTSVTITQT